MVNRVIGRPMTEGQQMRWGQHGAYLLVQIRVAVLEGGRPDVFRHWYPRFQMLVRREATPTVFSEVLQVFGSGLLSWANVACPINCRPVKMASI
jgi:hypothetical protein